MSKKILLLSLFLSGLLSVAVVLAQEFSSANFVNSNPVVTLGGGKSTSTNFQLLGGAGQIIIGESSSTYFTSKAGFFYFPFVTTPIVSAVAGDSQVFLTWTPAAGSLGFNINGYSIGQSVNSGGPYSFTNVGNTLTGAVTGLTNGATYYFAVRALDFFGDSVVTSTQVSATPIASPAPSPGGGAGIARSVSKTAVIFSGRAYPNGMVTLLKDAQIIATATAGADATFQINVSDISGGNYIFSVYAKDSKGFQSPLLTFPTSVISGAATEVSGILIPPSIMVDKSEVKRGNSIAIFGQSVPRSEVAITVNSKKEFFIKTIADKNGNYIYNFDTTPLSAGQYFAKAKFIFNGEVSSFGKSTDFWVGTTDIFEKPAPKCPIKVDLNNDCRVDLVDVSILIFWFDKDEPPPKVDFDDSKKVDLTDLSIMAYFWTG
jgi:hypothetical protein